MRWPNLTTRCQKWFAEVVAEGDHDLAELFAAFPEALANAEHRGSKGIQLLLDELETAELANLETRELSREDDIDMQSLADDLEALFREFGLWPDGETGAREAAAPYGRLIPRSRAEVC